MLEDTNSLDGAQLMLLEYAVWKLWFVISKISIDSVLYNHNKDVWAASWQNQQNGRCAQSDQSLRCPHKESLGP